MEPAVGVEHLFGVLFILVVALHDVFAADDDLAGDVFGIRRVDLHLEQPLEVAAARRLLEFVVGAKLISGAHSVMP